MAWVRRVRTASGATAVQIAESVGGRRRIVRHIGSARDDPTWVTVKDLMAGQIADLQLCEHTMPSQGTKTRVVPL